MAYRLEANISFGFHNSFVNTSLQVFSNASLDVNVLTDAESSQELTVFLSSYRNTRISAAPHLFEGLLINFSSLCVVFNRGRRLCE